MKKQKRGDGCVGLLKKSAERRIVGSRETTLNTQSSRRKRLEETMSSFVWGRGPRGLWGLGKPGYFHMCAETGQARVGTKGCCYGVEVRLRGLNHDISG
jgi:hypothetical protein